VPYYSNGRKRHGALDTPEDIANLTSLDVALRAFESGRYTGLGFALGYDGGGYWQGIDFDELSKNTNLTHLISGLPGYVEKSPSGDGVHAIGYGKHFISMGSNSTGIEAYCEGRYFTVTGNVVVNNPSTCLLMRWSPPASLNGVNAPEWRESNFPLTRSEEKPR
jgi:primase-polymerase (primpol)-like protein